MKSAAGGGGGGVSGSGGGWWARRSRRGRLLIIAIIVGVVVIALGLGIGLGLGLGQQEPSNAPPLPPTPKDRGIWQPAVNSTWQIILLKPMDINQNTTTVDPDVQVYDIDLFLNPKSTVDSLHRMGKKVICYFSAGSYEPDRPDSNSFKNSDKGKTLEGWPKEKWLNLNSYNVRKIMAKRMELAAEKGCDAVDPDNTDAYDNKNGLGMTRADAVNFIGFLSQKAQSLRLGIGLKNSVAIIPSTLPALQFSVNEQCVQYSECSAYSQFIGVGKPVFHIEYPSQVKPDFVSNFCKDSGPAQGSTGFSTVIKKYNLDGYAQYCNGVTVNTPTTETAPS